MTAVVHEKPDSEHAKSYTYRLSDTSKPLSHS